MAATAAGSMFGCQMLRILRTSTVGSGYNITNAQLNARKTSTERGNLMI